MNLEIKFRAWLLSEKRMVNVETLNICDVNSWIKYDGGNGFSRNFKLMQYIGEKDKNGKEIYDGDIIIAGWYWDKPHIIEFPNDIFGLIEMGLNGDDLEILGNVWGDPELRGKVPNFDKLKFENDEPNVVF